MGFYLRRSFRFGPLRFNLSKRGVGVSAGVKGLRAGVDASSKNYVAGGRGGLYFRERIPTAAPGDQTVTPPRTLSAGRVVAWLIVAAIVATVLIALGGCTTTGAYTFRNPQTGETASCERTTYWMLGGLSPWSEGITHAILMECVEKFKARGFTEQVFDEGRATPVSDCAPSEYWSPSAGGCVAR
jgi:hypothetical protein